MAATLSAAGGGSQGRILSDLNRSGDIARGGIDRFSLGLQQAAFAVDDSITTRGFSAAAKEARQLTRDLESLIKVQRDAREERLVSANPRGREIDSQINSLNRRLRDVTDAGQAAALRDEIGGLQDERRRLRQELPNRPAPTRTEVANSIGFRGFQSTASLLQGVVLDTIGTIASFGLNQVTGRGNTAARIGADSARAAGLIDPNNTLAIRAAIDARIRE
ncbi:MAG: hypothetical protein EBR82_72205, partial [Caulobacteraceae bacterium]|nr:hypothetical protein [Caulobacteraceae bacterium]